MKTTRVLLLALAAFVAWSADAANRKLVMIAGTPSHGPLAHEFNAGVQLLAKCLKDTPGLDVVVNLNGWPKDESIFNGADAVLIGGALSAATDPGALARDFSSVTRRGR